MNEELSELMHKTDLSRGKAFWNDRAYLFDKSNCEYTDGYECIILLKEGLRAGIVFRMDNIDFHVFVEPEFRGRSVLSSFLSTKLLRRIWPDNTRITISPDNCSDWDDFYCRWHLAGLSDLRLKDTHSVLQNMCEIFGPYVPMEHRVGYECEHSGIVFRCTAFRSWDDIDVVIVDTNVVITHISWKRYIRGDICYLFRRKFDCYDFYVFMDSVRVVAHLNNGGYELYLWDFDFESRQLIFSDSFLYSCGSFVHNHYDETEIYHCTNPVRAFYLLGLHYTCDECDLMNLQYCTEPYESRDTGHDSSGLHALVYGLMHR